MKITKKEVDRTLYINESKKKRKEKANENRILWTGVRSTSFEDKKKYNRKRSKKIVNKAIKEYCY